MIKNTPNNQELPFIAAVFTSLLCITFGANTVAIKVSLCYLGQGHSQQRVGETAFRITAGRETASDCYSPKRFSPL